MVPEKYRLAAVGRFLLEAFERRRPGLTAWSPEVEDALRTEAEAALVEMEKQCKEVGVDDPAYWQKARDAVEAVVIPRYAQLAKQELALAAQGYHLWRGGDLVARMAFAGSGLVLGALAVAIPWIPITEKWVPWALFVGGPLLPDAQLWFFGWRHRRRLQQVVDDLAEADRAVDTYRPLAELERVLEGTSADPLRASPLSSEEGAAGPEGQRPAQPGGRQRG
jgi:hypothetical protein